LDANISCIANIVLKIDVITFVHLKKNAFHTRVYRNLSLSLFHDADSFRVSSHSTMCIIFQQCVSNVILIIKCNINCMHLSIQAFKQV